jgi:hypothetical protein
MTAVWSYDHDADQAFCGGAGDENRTRTIAGKHALGVDAYARLVHREGGSRYAAGRLGVGKGGPSLAHRTRSYWGTRTELSAARVRGTGPSRGRRASRDLLAGRPRALVAPSLPRISEDRSTQLSAFRLRVRTARRATRPVAVSLSYWRRGLGPGRLSSRRGLDLQLLDVPFIRGCSVVSLTTWLLRSPQLSRLLVLCWAPL